MIYCKDQIKACGLDLTAEKFKGHVTIELTDVHTGEKQTIEGHNMVTNSVRNILRDNILGLLDLNAITPINKLFGGVFCFGETMTEDADNIRPVNDGINPLRAHAGQTSHSSASTLRGNPNGVESGEITGGYRFVWDFLTSQGNGTITSLGLVPSETGDIGLKPFDNSIGYGHVVGNNSIKSAEYSSLSREISMQHPRQFNRSTGEGVAIWRSGTLFEEIIVNFNTTKFYLNAGANIAREVSNRTATLTRSFDPQYSAVIEDDTNYYVIEIPSDGSNQVYMNTINKATFAVTNSSFTATGCQLYRFRNNNLIAGMAISPYAACDDTYFYLFSSSAFTMYRIQKDNTANISTLESNMTDRPAYNNNRLTGIYKINEGLFIGDNFIINADHIYKTAAFFRGPQNGYGLNSLIGDTYPNVFISIANTPISISPTQIAQNLAIMPAICTIYNLESAITKTSSQNMKITYEITNE